MPRRGLAATLSYEELLVIAGALSVTSAASMIFNLLQHRKMQVYKSAEEGILLREKVASSREELFKKSEQHLQVQLEAMTQRALINNNESFLNMATHAFSDMQRQAGRDLQQTYCDIGHIVAPLQKSLDQVGLKMDSMEKERAHSFTDLRRQVIDLISSQKELRTETASLVKALRSPTGRGQWGEMQLRRVIEIAGMVEHCDFVQQKQLAGNEDGPGLRPDVVVRLSGGRCVVVDAKTPLLAYLEAHDCKDEDIKLNLLKDHARHLKTHINNLSQKSYWSQLEVSPDFVVLFVPGEAIFGAALTADPTLIEYGGKLHVKYILCGVG